MDHSVRAYRFEGKTAIVTGASRGIGLAIARRLVAEGARVCITSRKLESLQAAAQEFPEGSVIAISGKVDDPDHRREVLDTVSRDFGHLDVLVNNVGINPVYGPLMQIDMDAARKLIDVNLFSTMAWIQDAYHHNVLNFAQSGTVVNLSSVTGQTPSPDIGLYGISKAAIEHLTRTLAVEMGPNVRVNAVAPAVVKTRFARSLYEGKEETVAARYPLGRLGRPEDVAAAVAFLASTDSDWITGQVINVDGGLLAAGGLA